MRKRNSIILWFRSSGLFISSFSYDKPSLSGRVAVLKNSYFNQCYQKLLVCEIYRYPSPANHPFLSLILWSFKSQNLKKGTFLQMLANVLYTVYEKFNSTVNSNYTDFG